MRSKIQPHVQDGRSFIEAARRNQIIQCAVKTIAALGYAGASLAAIAKRARISKSVISYYFPSKDDLMTAVVEHIYAAGAAYMRPRIEAQQGAAEALRAYITANIAFMAEHPAEVAAIREISMGFRDKDGRLRMEPRSVEHVYADLEALLRYGMDRGEFARGRADVAAHAIRAAIDAVPPLLQAAPETDAARFASDLADLFERALEARPAAKKGRTK